MPKTAMDWALIVGTVFLAHALFLVGAHLGIWGTDPNGHIHLKG